MSYDKRWHDIAKNWLLDCELPEGLAEKYTAWLAQRLQDVAEEAPDYIADMEHDAVEAAYDAHINRQIDEARGK